MNEEQLQNEINSCNAKFSALNFKLRNAKNQSEKQKLREEMEDVRAYENYLYSCQNESLLSGI